MISKQLTINNRTGLHARPISAFVQKAEKYQAQIMIHYKEKEVNAKSIMGVMSLGVGPGEAITLQADGEDEEEAIEELSAFIKEELSTKAK